MLPNELTDPSVFWDDLEVLIIQTEVWMVWSRGARNRGRLWWEVCKSSQYIPPCTIGFIPSGSPSDIYIIHEAAAMLGISSCMMNEIFPCRIWTEFVAPMGRVVRYNKLRGI